MWPFDKAVALRPAYLGCPVLNPLQLQEQLVEMMVWTPTELTPVIRQDGIASCFVGLEKRQHRLQIHLTDPLERADEEGVDRHQFPGVVDLNLTFAKLGAEALEQTNLLVIELNGLLTVSFLEAQQAVVFGERVVTLLHAMHPTSTDIDTLQSQFLCDPQRAMGWSGEGVIEDGLFNLLQVLLTLLSSLASASRLSLRRATFSLVVIR